MAGGYHHHHQRQCWPLAVTLVVLIAGIHFAAGGSTDLLLVADAGMWRRVSVLDFDTLRTEALPVYNILNPVAVDYDPVHSAIYWTDVVSRVIRRATLDGSVDDVILAFNDSCTTDGMAVDWVQRKVYYTDFSRKLIGRAGLNGSDHEVVLALDYIDAPRDIVVEPYAREMYWTDWGNNSRIEKASMDYGSNRKILVEIPGGWPNALAIDFIAGFIYWCDAKLDRIERIDLDGSNRILLVSQERSHFFGITLDASYLYVTDWAYPHVRRFERDSMVETPFGSAFNYGRLNGIHFHSPNFKNYREPVTSTAGPTYGLVDTTLTTEVTSTTEIVTTSTLTTSEPPVVAAVSPTFGPVSGGTNITITGRLLASRPISRVLIGKLACTIIHIGDTELRMRSPRGHEKLISEVLPVSIHYTGGPTLVADQTFLYWYDPEIGRIEPLTTILEGGIMQTVVGRHFDVVARPIMEITMLQRGGETPTPGPEVTPPDKKVYVSEDCVVHSEETMHCITPHMEFTPDQVDLLKADPRRHKEVDPPRGQLDFFVGFQLDGVTKYRNLTALPELHQYSQLKVSAVNPMMLPGGLIFFKPSDSVIHLRGKSLDQGARIDDYHVTIGGVVGEVQRLTGSTLTCSPPPPSAMEQPYGPNHHIVVRIGHYLSYSCGHLRYHNDMDTWVIVGCATGSAVLCFLLVILIACLVRRRRRKGKKCEDSPTSSSSASSAYHVIHHPNGGVGNGALHMRANDTYTVQLRAVEDIFPPRVNYAIRRVSGELGDPLATYGTLIPAPDPSPASTPPAARKPNEVLTFSRGVPNGVHARGPPGGAHPHQPPAMEPPYAVSPHPHHPDPRHPQEDYVPADNQSQVTTSSDGDVSDEFDPVYEKCKAGKFADADDIRSIYENVF